MITAHLPSGYVLARVFRWTGLSFAAALVGATFPDIDLIWFYFIDDRAFHHHHYWVHAPGFALACSALLLLVTRLHPFAVAFAAGWTLHILLDAPVGGLMWFWPFDNTLYTPIEVPPTRSHWVLSILTHWSVLMELTVWGAAMTLYLRRERNA